MEENKILNFVVDEIGNKHYLEAEIGSGGQGAVWKTKDPNIIVKMRVNPVTGEPIVNEKAYEKYKNEIIDEVRILGIPDHIHIAKPEYMLEKPFCGYVMRFLTEMIPIKQYIKDFKNPHENPAKFYCETGGLRHRLELLTNLAEIYTKLYYRSAVYADLSPENIFVSKDLNFAEVWLIDADNMRYRYDVNKIIFTPGYGAPEVVKGEINTLESDVYSFAVLAHEILTLNSPFCGEMITDCEAGWDDDETDNADLAEKGELPWIFDPEDDSNRCYTGFPHEMVFTKDLYELFRKTFSYEGRHNPKSRPKIYEWYKALKLASGLTAKCSYCGNTFFVRKVDSDCPFCNHGLKREKLLLVRIKDVYPIEEIIEAENKLTEEFNNSGNYSVEKISAESFKNLGEVNVCRKFFDTADGVYYLYNYDTSEILPSEKTEKTIEIKIEKGTFSIRNLSDKVITLTGLKTSYGELGPEDIKKFDNNINNLTLSMPLFKPDEEDEEDIYKSFTTRHIRFNII
ncbi:MAG: protein kinase [Clostridiales bacterium]|nr:protein kinase [Clostridiales bacterium]